MPALNVRVQVADFFKLEVPKDLRFDLIYDHTSVLQSALYSILLFLTFPNV